MSEAEFAILYKPMFDRLFGNTDIKGTNSSDGKNKKNGNEIKSKNEDINKDKPLLNTVFSQCKQFIPNYDLF